MASFTLNYGNFHKNKATINPLAVALFHKPIKMRKINHPLLPQE